MLTPNQQLTVTDHRRDLAGLSYVYPVVSRRAGGLSIGINLNTNNACNWRCVYCQVENLERGSAPETDLELLRAELDSMLESVLAGDFMIRHVPEELRRLNDIAISGNGEPTTSERFPRVVELIGDALRRFGLLGTIKVVLITNGSQMYKSGIRDAVSAMAAIGGEVWFKIDGGNEEDLRRVNQVALSTEKVLKHLEATARACPTWIQSCFFSWRGEPPAQASVNDYLDLLKSARARSIPLRGVLLYGVARPPLQAEGQHIGRLPESWWSDLGAAVEQLGLEVRISP